MNLGTLSGRPLTEAFSAVEIAVDELRSGAGGLGRAFVRFRQGG
jgi:hypothetical protein